MDGQHCHQYCYGYGYSYIDTYSSSSFNKEMYKIFNCNKELSNLKLSQKSIFVLSKICPGFIIVYFLLKIEKFRLLQSINKVKNTLDNTFGESVFFSFLLHHSPHFFLDFLCHSVCKLQLLCQKS